MSANLELDVENIDLLMELAKRYVEKKDFLSAINTYINVLVIDPGNTEAKEELFKLAKVKYIVKEKGHSDAILKAIWTSDGNFIASGGADNMIMVWHYPSGKIVRSFGNHEACITTIVKHPKEPLIASGLESGEIFIYNIYTCRKKRLEGHEDRVNVIVWSQEGKRLISGASDGKIIVWDPVTYKIIHKLEGHVKPVMGLQLSPGGRYFLSFSSDGVINIWNPKTGRAIYRITDPSGHIFSVAWSPERNKVASASADGNIRIFDIKSTRMRMIGKHEHLISRIFWNRPNVMVTVGWDGKVMVWDPTRLRKVMELGSHSTPIIHSALSRNGRYLATASLDRVIKVWNLSSMQQVAIFRGHRHIVSCLDWHPNSRFLLSSSWDKSIFIWNVKKEKHEATFHRPVNEITAIALNSEERYLAKGYSNGDVLVWDIESRKAIYRNHVHSFPVTSISWNSKGNLIATSSSDASVAIIDMDRADILSQKPIFSLGVNSVKFHPEKDIVLACSDDGTIKLLDTNCNIKNVFRGHIAVVSDLSWNSTGDMFSSSSWDGTVRIWKIGSEGEYLLIKYDERITCVDWNPKTNYISFGTDQGYIYVWSLDENKQLFKIHAHNSPIRSIRWSFDGVALASGGRNGTIFVYNIVRKKKKTYRISSPIGDISWYHYKKNIIVGCVSGDLVSIEVDI